jgi:hypothetical protein
VSNDVLAIFLMTCAVSVLGFSVAFVAGWLIGTISRPK